MNIRAIIVLIVTTFAMGASTPASEAKQHAPKCKVIDQYAWIDYWEKRNGSWIERTVTVTEKRCHGRGYTPREIVTSQVFGPWRPSE